MSFPSDNRSRLETDSYSSPRLGRPAKRSPTTTTAKSIKLTLCFCPSQSRR